MNCISTTLTPEEAQEATTLLLEARILLRDALEEGHRKPNYAGACERIATFLSGFSVEPD